MNEDGNASLPRTPATPTSADRLARRLDLARWSGGIVAAVGVFDGLLMAVPRREAPCPDGKYFPEGTTDFQCYVHPLALQGVAVMVISLLLGLLVLLTCAVHYPRARSPIA